MLIQEALKAQIEKLNMSQNEAARRMGMSRGALSDILRGRRSISEKVAIKMERVLGLQAEKILQLQTREALLEARNGESTDESSQT